jgi:hypothetical protein
MYLALAIRPMSITLDERVDDVQSKVPDLRDPYRIQLSGLFIRPVISRALVPFSVQSGISVTRRKSFKEGERDRDL